MEPETLTPEEALDRMKQNAQYVIEHYHEEWKITHITAIRYVNNNPRGLGTKKKKQRQQFHNICNGKRKTREESTTIDEQVQRQYKAHWADTDIETAHLEFFLDKKCAQQYKIAHATPVEGTTKTRVSWEPKWTDPQNIDSNPEHKAIISFRCNISIRGTKLHSDCSCGKRRTFVQPTEARHSATEPMALSSSQPQITINGVHQFTRKNPDLDISPPDKFTIQLQTISVDILVWTHPHKDKRMREWHVATHRMDDALDIWKNAGQGCYTTDTPRRKAKTLTWKVMTLPNSLESS